MAKHHHHTQTVRVIKSELPEPLKARLIRLFLGASAEVLIGDVILRFAVRLLLGSGVAALAFLGGLYELHK